MSGSSAPEGGQHGNDLLFPAHDFRQEHRVLFTGDIERLADRVLIAYIQEIGAFLQYVGDHQQYGVQAIIMTDPAHTVKKLLRPLRETLGVHAGDLTDRQIVACDVELLIVGSDDHLGALIVADRGGEYSFSQILQRDVGNAGHAVGNVNVPLRAGGRLEHDRVGDDGGSHKARHFRRGHQSLFLIHIRHDGGGAAHRLVADVDGVGGLDVRQTVVIHDFQNVRLIQTGHGLGLFVVIHQNHLLPAGTQQVEPGQRSHHVLMLVQNGVGPEPAFQHGVPYVVNVVVQMEAHQIVALADALNGQGVADQMHGPVGVIGGGNDAGIRVHIQQLLLHLCLTDDDAGGVQLNGPADHIRLVAADNDGFRRGEQQVFPPGRQGNGHFAGNLVPNLTACVQHPAFQNGQQIVYRHVFH